MSILSNDDFKRLSERNPEAYWRGTTGRPAYYDKQSPYYGRPTFRQEKAMEQSKLKPASVNAIIALVNEVLVAGGNKTVSSPKLEDNQLINYRRHFKNMEIFKQQLNLFGVTDSLTYKDLVWMRFTDSGHLGVIGASNDISFPQDGNNSYELIRFCNLKWATSFQLIFPLTQAKGDWDKIHKTETAVGNYLIENNIPVIDFFSHNY